MSTVVDFKEPNVDFYLASSDDKVYNLSKRMLSVTSEVFSNMFTNPAPPNEVTRSQDGDTTERPLKLAETAQILDLTLPLIYSDIRNLESIRINPPLFFACAKFADKYQMERVTRSLRTLVTSKIFLEEEPLRGYAACTHFGWKEEQEILGTACLQINLPNTKAPHEFEHVSGKAVQDLNNAWANARARSQKRLTQFRSASSIMPCQCKTVHGQGQSRGGWANVFGSPPKWAATFTDRLEERLKTSARLDKLFNDYELVEIIVSTGCSGCAASLFKHREYIDALQKDMAAVRFKC